MKSIILGVLFVATVAIAFPSQLSYNIGDEFDYTCSALVDSRGQMADGSRTSGSYSTLNGIVAVQVQDFQNGVYLFVMNMFDVTVNVGQGPASAKVPGTPLTSRDDEPLGYDMYFAQNTTGEITEIWYNEDDSPYFVNVKISAINAFQTRVVAPGANLLAAESDPAGYHYSSFIGGNQQTTLLVSKTFTEKDFTSFADPNVKPANLKLNALTSTSVHNDGYILGASVNQQVVITNANPQASSVASRTRRAAAPNTNTTGFDMNLSSAGQLTIALSQSGQNLRFGSAKKFNMAALTTSTLKKSTMAELGVKGVEFKKNLAPAMEITSSVSKFLGGQLTRSKRYTLANKLIRFFNANPAQLSLLTSKVNDKLSAKQIQSIFYVLAGVSNVNAVATAQQVLTAAGLNHRSVDRQLTAILALGSSLQDVTPAVMTRLAELAHNTNRRVSTHALLAASAILGRSKNADVVSTGKALLSEKLNGFLNRASDAEDLTVLLNAVGNAGPNGISLEANIQRLSQYANDEKYKALWISTFRKFPASEVMAKMPANLRAIIDSLDAPRNDLYPFNKNFSRDYKLGGESVNADFSFDLFLGTNFDCNQQYFNYLAYADVEAVVDVYDYSKSAFVAKATYGKANGVLQGNEIYVRFWDDVLYDQQLPTVDCNEHTYPLGHTAPGFSVSYTVWVSIIPVTFTASAALELNLSWGWQICDSQLSAEVELIPDAALVISGDADIDLLIIKAGLELDVDLDLELRPQGYIHGSECTIGVDVELTYEPSSAQFDGYYAWDHCKYWIFDCSWGKHNQQTFWSWNTAASNEIVYNQQWKIAKN